MKEEKSAAKKIDRFQVLITVIGFRNLKYDLVLFLEKNTNEKIYNRNGWLISMESRRTCATTVNARE